MSELKHFAEPESMYLHSIHTWARVKVLCGRIKIWSLFLPCMLINRVNKYFILSLKETDLLSALAVRMTKWLGKSNVPIHPKHFLNKSPWFVLGLAKNDIVLDLGSGNGQNAIKASRKCKKVIGLELDINLIDLAKKSSKKKNIVFMKANLEKNLPLKNNLFDRVIFLDVLEHLHNRVEILKEIHRVLKSGGRLFIGVPNSETSWKKCQRSAGISSFSDPDHKVEFTKLQISNLLKKSGFEIESFNYGKFDIPLRGLVDVVGAMSLSIYKRIDSIRANYGNKYPKEASGFEIVAVKK